VGRACPLCPGRSDINLFRYGKGVVDTTMTYIGGALLVFMLLLGWSADHRERAAEALEQRHAE
jgi:hypothetical protein